MVSRRIAAALLHLAGRRWPTHLREQVHREWAAELHVLAAEGRPWAMLKYAASLAAARPVREPVTAVARAAAMWRALRLTVVAPLAAVAVFIAALIVVTVISALLPSATENLQYGVMTVLLVAGAVGLARLGRWWTVGGAGTTTLVLAVTVPGFVLGCLQYAISSSSSKLAVHAPAYLAFFGGLAGLLYAVDRAAAAGNRTRAWWIGGLGALVLADVAVTVPVFLASATPDPASAPVWLFTAFTNSGFGLPSPAGWEIFTVLDATELDPQIFLLSSGLALGVIMHKRAGRALAAPGRQATEG
ncbi:hypothetical protein [Actinoplanes sp. NPDC049316]|uniref:hypothetical protein n=1 Tax=Actinoplanes sp. NPDC049316 TaxID=3154727 RepID=UPI003423B789